MTPHVARCAEAVQHDDRWTMPADAYVDLGAVGFDLTQLHTRREGVHAILVSVVAGHEASFRVERSERRRVAVCSRSTGIAPVVALVRSPVSIPDACRAACGRWSTTGRRMSTRASTGATKRATCECDATPTRTEERKDEHPRAQQTHEHRHAFPRAGTPLEQRCQRHTLVARRNRRAARLRVRRAP